MKKSVKKSVRLAPETIEAIRQISSFGEINWSGSINDIASRYMLFVEKSLPKLTKNEKMALAASFNGKLFDSKDLEREVNMLHLHISFSIESDSNVGEWLCKDNDISIDGLMQSNELKEFYERVSNWTFVERLAVIHYVTAFWSPKLISLEDCENDDG